MILVWPRGYETFLCSNQLSMIFILLINVEMPKIVGILTFISRVNTPTESFKARNTNLFHRFSFYEQLKYFYSLIAITKTLSMVTKINVFT